MSRSSRSGITWLEVLVLIALLLVLASLSLPAISTGLSRGPMTQVLSNMKQLHLAATQMTFDSKTSGDSDIFWTCSNAVPLSFRQWTNALTSLHGGYLSPQDVAKLLAYTKKRKFWFDLHCDRAIKVFAVKDSDPENTVLFTTKNWHRLSLPTLSGEPFGNKGFVVFRKDGNGSILRPRQADDPSLIGVGGHFNFLPLQ